MATCSEPRKKRARHESRYQMELNFASEDTKQAFLLRVERAKQRLAPRGSPPLDNRELLSSLLEMAEATPPVNDVDCLTAGDDTQSQAVSAQPMLDNSGLYVTIW